MLFIVLKIISSIYLIPCRSSPDKSGRKKNCNGHLRSAELRGGRVDRAQLCKTPRGQCFKKKRNSKGNGRKQTHAGDRGFQRVEPVSWTLMRVHAVSGDGTSKSFVWICTLKALRGLFSLNANIIRLKFDC